MVIKTDLLARLGKVIEKTGIPLGQLVANSVHYYHVANSPTYFAGEKPHQMTKDPYNISDEDLVKSIEDNYLDD